MILLFQTNGIKFGRSGGQNNWLNLDDKIQANVWYSKRNFCGDNGIAHHISRIFIFPSEKTAFLHLNPQCPTPMASWINNDGTVAEILDSDASTCFSLAGNEKNRVLISLPVVQMKPQFYVWLIGNLKCSPLNGLSVSIVGGCERGTCKNLPCVASDYVTSDGMGGCKYRCHSSGICTNIVITIVGDFGITRARSICEIVY